MELNGRFSDEEVFHMQLSEVFQHLFPFGCVLHLLWML